MKILLENGVEIVPTPRIADQIRLALFAAEAAPVVNTPPIRDFKPARKKGTKKVKLEVVNEAEAKATKVGYTDEEKANIISLYQRGEPFKTIAKMFKRAPTAIQASVYFWKKKGLIIGERQKQEKKIIIDEAEPLD